VSTIERLVQVLTGQYRWGLHPMKVLVALLAPVLVVWLADRRLRAQAALVADEESRARRLPRIRRR
jgi:hypothetical protein